MRAKQEMWAWKNFNNKLLHIHPSKNCVEMCSPDYFRSAIERGEGKIVKVCVTEIKE